MQLPLTVAAALLIGTAALPVAEAKSPPQEQLLTQRTEAISAAKRQKRRSDRPGHQAYGRSGTQIACTPFGCNPIPPGCRITTGYNPWTWDPTGFDEVVCPYYRR